MANNREQYISALKKGTAFNEAEMWEDAIRQFRVAISQFPKQPQPYAGLGDACFGLKKIDKALDCYKLAARYSQGDVDYLKKVADFQERLGQLGEAGRTYMAIGEVLLRRRELDSAIDNWHRAVRLESNLLGPHQRLAMVYQRQNNTKKAVREYLAIARIFQMQGENAKGMQMCRAALRLDPENEDVLTAMELIKHGAGAFDDDDEPEIATPTTPKPPSDDLTSAIRQMASVLEAQKQDAPKPVKRSADPIADAKRFAQEQLADEIFREEEDEDFNSAGLSKLERDALIGQGMDFHSRGKNKEAIASYEKAISGGLNLTAAYFSLGLLYHESGRKEDAKQILSILANDADYQQAANALIG